MIVYTDNEKLLPKHFQIIPDEFVTIRLIDTLKFQPPLISLTGFNAHSKDFYSRKVMQGPFTVENLCKFIKNNEKWNEYYERKKNLITI